MSHFSQFALVWIVLFPFLGAIVNGVAACVGAPKQLISKVSVGSVAIAFGLAAMLFASRFWPGEAGAFTNQIGTWFTLTWGGVEGPESVIHVPIHFAFVFDQLSGVMTLVVTGVGLLIHIYSTGYMHDDAGYGRFFAYLNLFTASMLILVLGSSLPLMFVGWEGVGLCSYLLIGFWYENGTYASAGKKAFVVNRIGDFGVLLGMFILVTTLHTFELSEINAKASMLSGEFTMGTLALGASVATVVGLLLFLGCTGKSAQIPLYVWLPDAMAGPTPVSALIHAATMVTAGVYLCCRLSGVFVQSTTAMAVIAIVGAATALLAATIAVVQNQMKKILAYSTVSQLGFMFAAVGAGAFGAGIFHVFTHAFFKACLFLGAGSVMHAVHAHGDADIRQLGGLKKWMPITKTTFLISCLAIAGIPPFSGFFSKDEILVGALSSVPMLGPAVGWGVFATLVLAATMTAFYMFRLYFLTFEGEFRGHGTPHESSASITGPLWILAAGAAIAGFLGLPHDFLGVAHFHNIWAEFLQPSLASFVASDGEHEASAVLIPQLAGLAAGGAGLFLAFNVYRQQHGEPAARMQGQMPGLHRLVMDKWRVDEFYERTVIWLVRKVAEISGWFDKYIVDGVLSTLTSVVVQAAGWAFTRIQNGVVYTYAAAMVVGLVAVTWWFIYPHPSVETKTEGNAVEYTAAAGHGYEYRWDVDGDGKFDTEWRATAMEQSHRYTAEEVQRHEEGYALVIEEATPMGAVTGPKEVYFGAEGISLDGLFSGPWENGGAAEAVRGLPPAVTMNGETHEIELLPNGAAVELGGRMVSDKQVIAVGQTFSVGTASIRVAAVARAVLEVRNVFGNVATKRLETLVSSLGGAQEPVAMREEAP